MSQVKNWFPLYPSKELAALFAAIITDGHLDWNAYDFSPRPKKIILYSNYEFECNWFLDLVYRLFNVKGKLVRYRPKQGFSTSESCKAIVYNAPLARILIAIGTPPGDKTLSTYSVPNWIMDGDSKIKRSFLKILFNFDGSISIRKTRSTAEINFCFTKHQKYASESMAFMEQIKSLLSDFDIPSGKIHVRKAKYEKYPNYDKNIFMLFISSHKGLINFYREIGFLNPKKQTNLENFIHKTYKSARVSFRIFPSLLTELKERYGTDKNCVSIINKYSKNLFTYRQFEHIRRGELKIPLQMLISTLKLLNKKEEFEKIPKHYQNLINIYDNYFLR